MGVVPVGRLDKDTEGLLLLTNDGIWGHSIINGHKHVPKVYYVEFVGELSEEGIQRIKEGIVLGDGTQCKPALIELLSDQSATITIEEGKYHQVKRMNRCCWWYRIVFKASYYRPCRFKWYRRSWLCNGLDY